jgi:hypothetical protein
MKGDQVSYIVVISQLTHIKSGLTTSDFRDFMFKKMVVPEKVNRDIVEEM